MLNGAAWVLFTCVMTVRKKNRLPSKPSRAVFWITNARVLETIVGRPHIILEHISGPEGMGSDLRSWIDRKRLDLPQSMEFGLHIALGMQQPSTRVPELVHRDLKLPISL